MTDDFGGHDALGVALTVGTKWDRARVFPTRKNGNLKMPAGIIRSWKDDAVDASTDAGQDQIERWWPIGAAQPYGIGVTGILSIDCDADPDGDAAVAAFGPDVLTGIRIRGNPGRVTFLFRQPDQPFGDGHFPGGDVKGSGYVVLPPSRHFGPGKCALCDKGDKHHYEWLTEWNRPLPTLTPDLVERLDGLVSRQGASPAAEVTGAEIEAWSTAGAPCRTVRRYMADYDAAMSLPGAARHGTTLTHQERMLRLGEQGHNGVKAGLDHIKDGFWHSLDKVKDADARRDAPRWWADALSRLPGKMTRDGLTPAEAKGCCGPDVHEAEDSIFGATPLLSDMRQHARAHQVSPYALLGSCLARVVSETPHWFTLPEFGSLNLYVALVGGPGVGKSTAHKAAGRYLVVDDPIALPIGQGTGEGLMQAFMELDPDKPGKSFRLRDPFPNVLMFVDEVDQMSAMNGRNGAIGDSLLRSLWSGSYYSTWNSDVTRRREVPADGYRLALVMGVQPTNGNHLFGRDAMNSGTAQRWLCLPAWDDGLDVDAVYEAPAHLLSWQRPAPKMGGETIRFPESVLAHVRRLRAKVRARRADEDESVESHAAFQRMKVAAALALLHEGTEVTLDLWALSGALMEVSDRTRGEVLAATSRDAKARAVAEGVRTGHVDVGKAKVLTEQGAKAVGRLVRSCTKHKAGCTRNCLSERARLYRDVLDDCIIEALRLGLVVRVSENHYGA